MSKQPAGSIPDTTELAKRYSENRSWQHERGLLLLDITAPSESKKGVGIQLWHG